MIDEERHDLAIEYLLGSLEGEAGREFEAWLESDSDLRKLVDELRDATASLVHSVPWHKPPPALREKILALARGESTQAAGQTSGRSQWIPWAVAASLAVACAWLYVERARWRNETRQAKAEISRSVGSVQAAKDQATKLAEQVLISETQSKIHLDQITELRDEIVKLRGRDALAQVRIAALGAQLATFAKAGAIVVWDQEQQRGVIQFTNMPKPASGKDYQLWVIDPKYPAPVSAGIISTTGAESGHASFKPVQEIENANKFAISVEPAGGVAAVSGPIVFVGE